MTEEFWSGPRQSEVVTALWILLDDPKRGRAPLATALQNRRRLALTLLTPLPIISNFALGQFASVKVLN